MKKSRDSLDVYQQHKMTWTVRFGYILFATIVLITVIQATQSINMLALHQVPDTLVTTIIWYLAASSLIAIIFPLIVYIIGERTNTKAKSVIEHHYTGVLFGLLSAWMVIVFSAIPYLLQDLSHAELYLQYTGPVLAFVTAIIIAVVYGQQRPQPTLNHFAPFQVSFFVMLILSMCTVSLPILASDEIRNDPLVSFTTTLWPVLAATLLIAIGARFSREVSRRAKVLDGIIALSIGVWFTGLTTSLLSTLVISQTFGLAAPLLSGFLVWALYIYLIHIRFGASKRKTR